VLILLTSWDGCWKYGRRRNVQNEFDPRTVQPVASRYTDWATGPTKNTVLMFTNEILTFNLHPIINVIICNKIKQIRKNKKAVRIAIHEIRFPFVHALFNTDRIATTIAPNSIESIYQVFPFNDSHKIQGLLGESYRFHSTDQLGWNTADEAALTFHPVSSFQRSF
jgi:hypothetical protein